MAWGQGYKQARACFGSRQSYGRSLGLIGEEADYAIGISTAEQGGVRRLWRLGGTSGPMLAHGHREREDS